MAVAIGLGLFVGLLALGMVTLSRRPTDPLFLFFVVFAMFYGLRAVLVGTGLDSLNPDYLFVTSDQTQLVAAALFHMDLFLASFIGAAWFATRSKSATGGVLFMSQRPAQLLMNRAVASLTVLTLLTTASLVFTYGGIGTFMAAAKLDKALAGQYVLKLPAMLGSFISAAAVIDALQTGPPKRRRMALLLACTAFNALCVFAWGQRSVVVVVMAMLILGAVAGRDAPQLSKGRIIGRVLLAGVIVITASFCLRVVRDITIHDDGPGTDFASSTTWRQLSVSVNGVYFDASALAFRDWPSLYSYRGGQDFIDGGSGTVPRVLNPDKPEPLVGRAFRQVYEPEVANGWPVGTPTIWYLNFGLPGVIFGGMLSGALVGFVSRRCWAAPASGINVAVSIIVSIYVLQLGVSSETLFRLVLWLGPLAPVLWILRSSDRQRPDRRSDAGNMSASRRKASVSASRAQHRADSP
ncbi:MAG: hypothetical protein WBG36_03895 [Ornithinimicrobium sp.]